MFIDTHCHLSKKDYEDISKVIEDNRNANVLKIVISGCTKEDIDETIEIINNYSDVYATIGYHPEEADNIEKQDLIKLEELLSLEKVIGIGEIGLDYHYSKENKEKQLKLFEYQLALAEKYHLPVVIHTRDATKDTIDILRKYNLKGIIHCFSGSVEMAKEFIKKGFLISVGGIITFKNAKNIIEVIKNIDLSYILLETDSPYLTPEPFRKEQNEPMYIPIIASKIADILNVSIEEVSSKTTDNAKRLFDF